MFIAHKREEDNKEQPLIEHLEETASLAGKFGDAFNNSKYAYLCGLLHDIGKYSREFQNRILYNGKRCDHSTAGARILYKCKPFGILGSYCIAGHHSGLQNCGSRTDVGGEGTLYGRLAEEYEIPDYAAYLDEVDLSDLLSIKPSLNPLNKGGFSVSFFIRMIYSSLVDADFLNTEYFMRNGMVDRRVEYDFKMLYTKLHNYIKGFSTEGLINKERNSILMECIKKAEDKQGLYTLTVPTGGGKTVSSMAFAINHLLKNNMDRIIYVIPYTSIIEQNAKVFRDIFGGENVLEHHSNFDFKDDDEMHNRLRLSTENWDMPIIVTTNVQFFESLFANKSSKCRKIHNIANSVIIFDEVQMLPVEYLTLCINSIAELVHNYKSTAVLCSATQPAIAKMFPTVIISNKICKDTSDLYETFKRIKCIKRGIITSEELAEEMNDLSQCLCIVNTRRHALKIYKLLKGEGNYHLSTLMCPAHRQAVLKDIKERLKNKLPCKVVSTRLIEAGVDVDFPIVYRSIGGLDSIVQAAGRCNREGKLTTADGNKTYGEVHIFEPEEEFSKMQPPSFKREIEVTKQIMLKYQDITSPEAIDDYFSLLYVYLGTVGLDAKDLYQQIEMGFAGGRFEYDFETIAEKFKIIGENTKQVIIPYNDDAIKNIKKLKYSEYIGKILRSLQSYTVSVYEREYNDLLGSGKLRQVKDEIMELVSMKDDYNDNTGLVIKSESGIGIYM